MKYFLACILWIFFSFTIVAQEDFDSTLLVTKKVIFTKKIQTKAPVIDADLGDSDWDLVEWGEDFIQSQPYDGKAPSQKTAFKMLYDDKYVYFAFKCYDDQPDKILKRLSRRDGFSGDWIDVQLDCNQDLNTAFSFNVSAAGVKSDEFISKNGGNWDDSWDPIWNAKAKIDSEGWTAEIRIPLSQLRYSNDAIQKWGIQVRRKDIRGAERSIWQYIPRDNAGWVSRFGTVEGLQGIRPQKQIEIQPYIVAQVESYEKESGNPFSKGSGQQISAGLDGKIGISSNFTMDFTINPDFGQVEADPSVITLDGFQIFFQERRPFFIEGRNIFDFRLMRFGGGSLGRDNLFYSRRIGGQPKGSPELTDEEYSQQPDNTTILGAAKISGKTKNGLSIGILETVTSKESAQISLDGEIRKEVVEPLTNYFISRVQQDFNDGNRIIGGIFTATNRSLKDTGMNGIHKSAYTGGVDFTQWWNNRKWVVAGRATFSNVNGSTEAILNTQTEHGRYFQRTDADHLQVDSTATSLTGHGGALHFGKLGGDFRFMASLNWRSPKLDLNDLGFIRRADEIQNTYWFSYNINKPFSIFRVISTNLSLWHGMDFSGTKIYYGGDANAYLEFKNNYSAGIGCYTEPYARSNSVLRGGPGFRFANEFNSWFWLDTDTRKKLSAGIEFSNTSGMELESYSRRYQFSVTYRPVNTLEFRISPSYTKRQNILQYVDNQDFGNETRYLNGTISQETFDMSLRINYTIKPNLSIQYYGQPYISQGVYHEFKYITDPLATEAKNRFASYDDNQISYNAQEENYLVDENKDGLTDFEFSNPNFSYLSFRSNLVLRWEYISGSEIFLVWTQNSSASADPLQPVFRNLESQLFENKSKNIFLIKLTYRFLK